MAVDPSQRMMFRGMPGVNPREIAGGIYNLGNMGGAPPPVRPVAAQPIQVARTLPPPPVAASPAAPGAVPPPVAASPAIVPLAALPDDFQTLYDSTTALIEDARDKGEDVTELLESRSSIVQRAAEAGVDLVGPEDEGGEVREADIATVAQAATGEIQKAEARGEAPAGAAAEAVTQGQATIKKTLAAVRDAETSFEAQIQLGNSKNVLKGATAENYNKLAKQYLGLDEDEADVPEWAAPIFLFGLNLMKAPVSSKTSDTGVTGLLADIGAAGEVGFAGFGKERARRRAERAAIGQVALKLKTADDATRIAGLKADLESARWFAKFTQDQGKEKRLVGAEKRLVGAEKRLVGEAASKAEDREAKALDRQSTFFATQFDRVLNRYTQGQKAERIGAFSTEFYGMVTELGKKEGGAQKVEAMYRNPAALNLLGGIAAKRAGLAPDFATKELDFGRNSKLTYATAALEDYARKTKQLPGAVLTKIVNDPDNEKWAGIAIATNMSKDQIKMTLPEAQGVVTPTWIDTVAQDKEFVAANKAKRDINPAAFTKTGTPYLKANQNFTEISLGDVGGVKKRAFVNFSKLAIINAKREKDNKDPLEMTDLLKTPHLAPGVVSQKFSDTSGALNNISTLRLNIGPYTSQTYLFNKNLLETKASEIASALEISQDEVSGLLATGTNIPFEVLQEFGVLTPIDKPKNHETPITRSVMTPTGWEQTTGSLGDVNNMDKAKARREMDDAVTGTMQLNRQLFISDRILASAAGGDAVSKWTDVKSKISVAGSMLGIPKNRNMRDLRTFSLAAGSTSDDRAAVNTMLTKWEKTFDSQFTQYTAKERQRLKSLFINMAFTMASTREKGKLTDKDVDWAFRTLGFDTDAYLQDPEVVRAGLRTAAADVNTDLEVRLMQVYKGAPEIRKHNAANPDNKRFALEEVLAKRSEGVDYGKNKPFYTTPEGAKVHRFDMTPQNRQGASSPAATGPAATGQNRGGIVIIPEAQRAGHLFGGLNGREIKVPPGLSTAWTDLRSTLSETGTTAAAKKWAAEYVNKRVNALAAQTPGASTDEMRRVYQTEARDLLMHLDSLIGEQ